eukprot:COSAG02_NODE_662_length_18752_cov_10.146464_11_plen_100_part_00
MLPSEGSITHQSLFFTSSTKNGSVSGDVNAAVTSENAASVISTCVDPAASAGSIARKRAPSRHTTAPPTSAVQTHHCAAHAAHVGSVLNVYPPPVLGTL